MSFGFGFGAGLRALAAARMGIQTAGNNIANANTPGYSRQRVELMSAIPFTVARGFQVGSGVEIGDIARMVDEGLERRIRTQLGMVGAAEVDQSHYSELEGILAEPDGGLSSMLADFFGSIGSLQSNPADRALRGGLVQTGSELAQGLNLLSRRFTALADNTFVEVSGLVRQVNEDAAAVAELNIQIMTLEAAGGTANDLRDTREQKIKEIARLIDTTAIPRDNGTVDLLIGGHLLVSGDRVTALRAARLESGGTSVTIGNGAEALGSGEGRIAALIRQERENIPSLQKRIDRMTRNMILEFNRIHTTGMPKSGPFSSLASFYGAVDGDGDGHRGDEMLNQLGLLFDVRAGALYVSVTDLATGRMERSRIDIDPASMTLEDVAAAIDGVAHLSASVDPTGRLRVNADNGYGFDFSPRLNEFPDSFGSMGGRNPSIGTGPGPFDLSGQTFPVGFTVTTGTASSPVTTTVTLDASDFGNTSAVTADELVAALNKDLGGAAVAANIGGRVVIRSNQGGSTSQIALANIGAGTVLSDLGLSTATVTGRDQAIEIRVEGSFTGSENGQFVFVPSGDGTIGVTPELRMNVYDQSGNLVTVLDVGAGYTPGESIEVDRGVSVTFGAGEVSATAGNVFALDTLADSDTTDLLVALGMNSFFHGSSSADISVNADLLSNPDLLAAGISPAASDSGNLLRMLGLRDSQLAELDSNTIEDFYADMVGDVGFEAASANAMLQGQDTLLAHLEAQRESVSGVNIDEEMIDMTRYQQAYEAAARFIATVQDMTETLINIGR
ncbi:MAG: hypothetical protein Fur0037_05660 [Planctomycetota bacterium]